MKVEKQDTAATMEAIRKRLDIIVGLIIEWDPEGGRRKPLEQSVRLGRAGLRPVEIVAITGRDPGDVSRDLSKKGKRKKGQPASASGRKTRR